jgi:hypothetical protein
MWSAATLVAAVHRGRLTRFDLRERRFREVRAAKHVELYERGGVMWSAATLVAAVPSGNEVADKVVVDAHPVDLHLSYGRDE